MLEGDAGAGGGVGVGGSLGLVQPNGDHDRGNSKGENECNNKSACESTGAWIVKPLWALGIVVDSDMPTMFFCKSLVSRDESNSANVGASIDFVTYDKKSRSQSRVVTCRCATRNR